MVRIAGVRLQDSKVAWVALTGIYGIGAVTAKRILAVAGVDLGLRVNALSDSQWKDIRAQIDLNYTVEGDLRKVIELNIRAMVSIKCYRGLKHRSGLPVRGQNTHNNARTRKGRGKAITNKKKV